MLGWQLYFGKTQLDTAATSGILVAMQKLAKLTTIDQQQLVLSATQLVSGRLSRLYSTCTQQLG